MEVESIQSKLKGEAKAKATATGARLILAYPEDGTTTHASSTGGPMKPMPEQDEMRNPSPDPPSFPRPVPFPNSPPLSAFQFILHH